MLAETGAAKVDLVGHSEGAFQSLYVPKVAGYAPTAFVNEPGVTNYYVQDKCPFDPVGHTGITVDSGITSMILNGLDDGQITCGFGLPHRRHPGRPRPHW